MCGVVKLVSRTLPFLMGSSTPGILPVFLEVFCKCALFICRNKSGVRDNEKRFVERQRTKETINSGSPQMDFIDELLYTDIVPFFFRADVQKLFRKTFSSFFDISIGFKN